MSAITLDGDLVHYEVLGRGRPVVLIHGMLGSWRYWIPTIQTLQQHFRVYAIDLFGFGDSARKPARYGLEQQVGLIEQFLREMGVPKAVLIGHDVGAIVATEFARRHPEVVPRLIVVSAPLFDPGSLDQRTPPHRSTAAASPASVPARPAIPVASSGTPGASGSALRMAVMEAASQRAARPVTSGAPVIDISLVKPPVAAADAVNPFRDLLAVGSETLLARCFRRGEPNFEKLSVEVARADAAATPALVASFDAGTMLDVFRLLPMPIVFLHGMDDPITPAPSDAVLNYLTTDGELALLPALFGGVRHFPMLEEPRFSGLVKDCLEAADISKVAVKERWVRRTR